MVVWLFVLLSLGSCTKGTSEFPIPQNMDIYTQDTEDFFSYYFNIYPATDGTGLFGGGGSTGQRDLKDSIYPIGLFLFYLPTVLYGSRAKRASSDAYGQSINLQKNGVATRLPTNATNTELVIGTLPHLPHPIFPLQFPPKAEPLLLPWQPMICICCTRALLVRVSSCLSILHISISLPGN